LSQADHVKQLVGALAPFLGREMKQVAKKIQRLVRVEIAVEIRFLRQIADARLGGHVSGGLAEDFNVPFRGIKQPEQQLDRGGFPRTIRSEQPEDFSAPDLEINTIHGPGLRPAPEILEHLRQSTHGDDDLGTSAGPLLIAGSVWCR
jgi:hypothetical protein